MSEIPFREPGRRTPAQGVHISLGGPNWVFLTVCTEKREHWLAQASVQRTLHEIWEQKATAWLVSDYLLLPDHLHLFCAPRDLKFTVEQWIAFWKDQFAKAHPDVGTFQRGGFHHRLRDGESYSQKWQSVRENPVRHKLAERPEDWPYFGRVHEIRWSGRSLGRAATRPYQNPVGQSGRFAQNFSPSASEVTRGVGKQGHRSACACGNLGRAAARLYQISRVGLAPLPRYAIKK